MARSTFVYVTYIRTTLQQLWSALMDPEFVKQYWFEMHCESGWMAGPPWKLVSAPGVVTDAGDVIQAAPPRRLVIRLQNHERPALNAEGESFCTMEQEPSGSAVKLFITHTIECEPSKLIDAVSGGWSMIISNLKSMPEPAQWACMESADASAAADARFAHSCHDISVTCEGSTNVSAG